MLDAPGLRVPSRTEDEGRPALWTLLNSFHTGGVWGLGALAEKVEKKGLEQWNQHESPSHTQDG